MLQWSITPNNHDDINKTFLCHDQNEIYGSISK